MLSQYNRKKAYLVPTRVDIPIGTLFVPNLSLVNAPHSRKTHINDMEVPSHPDPLGSKPTVDVVMFIDSPHMIVFRNGNLLQWTSDSSPATSTTSHINVLMFVYTPDLRSSNRDIHQSSTIAHPPVSSPEIRLVIKRYKAKKSNIFVNVKYISSVGSCLRLVMISNL